MEIIIGLLAGVAAANALGVLIRSIGQGVAVNSVAGLVGGGVGAIFIAVLGSPSVVAPVAGAGDLTVATAIAQGAVGGAGGAVALVVTGLLREALGR